MFVIFMRSKIFAAVVCVADAPSDLGANSLSDENIFRVGRNMGRVAWGMRWCNMKSTELAKGFNDMATAVNAQAFKRGFDDGILEGLKYDREMGRTKACSFVYDMYGPDGVIGQGLVK